MRIKGTHKSLASAINGAAAETRRQTRARSSLTIGEWTLEARPDGLHAIHGPTSTSTLVAVTPPEGTGQ